MSEGGGVVFIPPVVPGHLAVWAFTNVLADGGAVPVVPPILSAPTQQRILVVGAGTYNTPPGAREIRVRMMAGGGGGAGAGNSGVTDGIRGGTTSFNAITVIGGEGGASGGRPGQGGTGGVGAATFRAPGTSGYWPSFFMAFPNHYMIGGMGGGWGTRLSSYTDPVGNASFPNTGSGGQGGTFNAGATFTNVFNSTPGFSGGQAEYAELIITSPAASYAYVLGDGGNGGGGGGTGGVGGKGGSGFIIVDEYY